MATYIFGKLTRSKFYTPHKAYSHKTDFPADMYINKYVPCKFDNNTLQVFYNAPVFNSYLTVAEEEVYKLHSTDTKTTITKSKIEPNTLYTFRIIEETKSIRICEVYGEKSSTNLVWVGKETTGKLNISKKRCEITTPIGKGECILQNNTHKKKPIVILWKVDNDKLYFVEVKNAVQGPIEVNIDSVRDSFVLVSNDNIRGIIFTEYDQAQKREKKTLKVYAKEELLGFYVFNILEDLQINSLIQADIIKKTDTQYILKYQTYTGFINITNLSHDKLNNDSKCVKNDSLRGKIIDIKNGQFEMSQVQNISVPFDAPYISDSESESEDVYTPATATNLPEILNLIKKFAENKKYKEVTETFYKYIHTLNTADKDNLCLVYTNFLQFTSDQNLIKEIGKVSKFCTDKFLIKVGETSDNYDVVRFCYTKYKDTHKDTSKDLKTIYKKYGEMCYESGKDFNDMHFIDCYIDLLYKYEDSPRIKTEKIVGNDKLGWIRYIENESEEYKRALFRRVVDLKWKVGDMKEWYKMWMAYEKEVGGNLEEVRSKAKEFVDSIKQIN